MHNNLKDKALHYLCADFHVYQHQLIDFMEFKLDVHIVGTGGADKDDYFDPAKHSIELLKAGAPGVTFISDDTLSLKISNPPLIATCLNSKKEFGYLKITEYGLNFQSIETKGGRKTKRRRKRSTRTKRQGR